MQKRTAPLNIRFLFLEGCPGAARALQRLEEVLHQEGLAVPVERIEVTNPETAEREGFLGSPTIQVNGLDIEIERRGESPCFGCRIYPGDEADEGVPPEKMIRDAIRRALAPPLRLLFLCTGNSCRSQMAEGWTRRLRGDLIEPYSAGVKAGRLDPLAVEVMKEAAVDISGQRSKQVGEVLDVPFDYVITLCDHARETCPLFPGNVKVLHRGFDDPPELARTAASRDEALKHYRRVRDEIRAFVETLPEALGE